jgi:energy-coupling factor transporter ATP-binding protein EcfA2
MKLKRFRVTNFRSVEDSEWIETDEVTALIGTNESGKTNLLLPLWKLHPAKDGEIKPTSDFPRKHYTTFRNQKTKPIFIRAVFESTPDLASALSKMTGIPQEQFLEIESFRRLDGNWYITFPGATPPETLESVRALTVLQKAQSEIDSLTPMKSEQETVVHLKAAIASAIASVGEQMLLDAEGLAAVLALLPPETDAPKSSSIVPRYSQLREDLEELRTEITKEHPDSVKAARDLAAQHIPKFVYYSNYGNLDSEIYLPHVIENMKRDDLGAREQAKARTLKVLFEFVGLQPEEILELGKDFKVNPNREPTDEEIALIAEKKKERSILLQSASAKLTHEFRDWWRQGEYRFRFEADGDHFRIWVSDDRRPEEVELEGRSTGLQWFLSFYLVFLVESRDAHQGAILLLDEPGLSLHPLAQRDLSAFFDGLAEKNQLLYTTHSPFLVDADRLDRARKVYVAKDGTSKATADLRAPEGDHEQKAAGYAVHAALGLTVAESLLLGCEPIIVEGLSDQIYLSTIKTMLIATGDIKPGRELVFPPAGGAKGVKVVAGLLSGRDESLPVVLFDSDTQGRAMANQLRTSLYATSQERVLEVGTFLELVDAEIEDLMPPELLAQILDRWQRAPDRAFADDWRPGQAIVPQIEAWANRVGVKLAAPAWKVELSKRVKEYLLSRGSRVVDAQWLEIWKRLFDSFFVKPEGDLGIAAAVTTDKPR